MYEFKWLPQIHFSPPRFFPPSPWPAPAIPCSCLWSSLRDSNCLLSSPNCSNAALSIALPTPGLPPPSTCFKLSLRKFYEKTSVQYLNWRIFYQNCWHRRDNGRGSEAVADHGEVCEVSLDAGVQQGLGPRVAQRAAVLVQEIHKLFTNKPARRQTTRSKQAYNMSPTLQREGDPSSDTCPRAAWWGTPPRASRGTRSRRRSQSPGRGE